MKRSKLSRWWRSLFGPKLPVWAGGSRPGAAVCVGLTRVDPKRNGGWSGECPGCDVDCTGLGRAATEAGLSTVVLQNAQATWRGVTEQIRSGATALKRGDLLLLSFSGHGGQRPDKNGDEPDGKDETLCMWDGQVCDDDVLRLLHSLPAGLRVVLISDQCHSEGNFRVAPSIVQAIGSRRALGWDGALIQFAGCRESSYSYGSNTGGTWTQALLATLHGGQTWRSWFAAAAAKVTRDRGRQEPVWVEYGNVTDEFRNALVFTAGR
jgi:hypothetical protein